MLRHVGGGEDSLPGFDLSGEILSVIPTDPFEQLDLARKITSMAIASRVSNLEVEVVGLRQNLQDKERAMHEVEEKMSGLERDRREADSRLKIVLDDNMKLTKEQDSLAMTVKKLGRDFAKLETFKRLLIQSLSDENASQTELVDIGTCNQRKGKRSFSTPFLQWPYRRIKSGRRSFTPAGTPKIISTSVSPRGYPAAGSPERTSGAVSPSGSRYKGNAASLWYPSSQQILLPEDALFQLEPHGWMAREFFRHARSRPSYEQFSAFSTYLSKDFSTGMLVKQIRNPGFGSSHRSVF